MLNYFEGRADRSLIQSLDNNQYDESSLVTIKMPLSLPYTGSRDEFERYDGTIQINGVFYNYVKRKFFNDTLTLLCIPNREKTRLYAENNEYAKSAAGAQSPASSNERTMNSLLKSFFPGYNQENNESWFVFFTGNSRHYIMTNDSELSCCFLPLPSQPPELI